MSSHKAIRLNLFASKLELVNYLLPAFGCIECMVCVIQSMASLIWRSDYASTNREKREERLRMKEMAPREGWVTFSGLLRTLNGI